ncbi:FAD-dependent monooxygenase [Nocardia sp. XZ_19_369]|uniref:FAD-dependent monooxygenase n=1 Tax=Nocardia sp. XZ_19_369 TaxID=2769487 RepID=UPI00188F0D45|nr:FAD-dependent monooxygenase [Nocardia sp. XZ_19_369]
MTNTNILISGAGVAGPALAYWLRRHGYTPTVAERAAAPRPGGYAVDFRGAAITVLERMGILDEVRKNSTTVRDSKVVDSDGRHVVTMPAAIFAGELEVLKSDLTDILYALTEDETEYLFDNSITALDEDADGVLVRFERGEPRRFDLVVGADGMYSKVRALAFGAHADYLHHLGVYNAIFATDNFLNLDYEGRACQLGDGRSANVFSARDNTEARAALYFAAELLDYDRRDLDAQKRLLAERFAGDGWEMPRLLEYLAASSDLYLTPVSQVRMDTWSKGRIVLLGDACACASPLSGRGTSQALIGAYILAGELATAAGDYAAAFASYENQLRDYVKTNQAGAEEVVGMMFAEPPPQEVFDAMAANPPEADTELVTLQNY